MPSDVFGWVANVDIHALFLSEVMQRFCTANPCGSSMELAKCALDNDIIYECSVNDMG